VIARNQLIGLIAGVVLIVAALTGALLLGSDIPYSSPEAVVRSYLIAVYENGDASQYLALFDRVDLQELAAEYGIPMEEVRDELQASLDDLQEQIASEGMSFSWQIEDTIALNATAETTVAVRFSHPTYGDDEYPEIVATVERDGRWYLAAEALEAFVQWLLESRAAAGTP
jgi:hypothetical protein